MRDEAGSAGVLGRGEHTSGNGVPGRSAVSTTVVRLNKADKAEGKPMDAQKSDLFVVVMKCMKVHGAKGKASLHCFKTKHIGHWML